MRTILWYPPQWNRSDSGWCSSVLTASTDTQAFIVSSWQGSGLFPSFLLCSCWICISLSSHCLHISVSNFRFHACRPSGLWDILTSVVTFFSNAWFWFWTRPERWDGKWDSRSRGGKERQAFKAVIIRWKSLVNMQYPFTIRSVRRLKPNCKRTKAKSH